MNDVTIEVPAPDDFDEMSDVDARNFGYVPTVADIEVNRRQMQLDRFRIARDAGGDMVGLAGTWALELTLPGNAILPMAGLTWVSVTVSHRRRGLLTRLMNEIHDDVVARGEPLVGLLASEGAIYERYGYGVATRTRVTSVDARRARFRDDSLPPAGAIRLVDPTKHIPELEERWDRFRRVQPGEISRPGAWFEVMFAHQEKAARACVLHADGFAIWTTEQIWSDGHPRHKLTIDDFAASTTQAHVDLWKTILSVDLVGEVSSHKVLAPADPLPYLLTDPRLVRTVELNDGLWLCPLDPAKVFGARSYRVDDELVLDIEGERITVGAGGAEPTERPADLETNRSGAGALALGGVSASELAAGRRLRPLNDGVLGRADALFGWDPPAHLRTMF